MPSAIKPAIGDVWLCNDGRLIVVTKIDDSAFGNIRRVYACINGEWLEPFIDLWPMVLLSMQATPLGNVYRYTFQLVGDGNYRSNDLVINEPIYESVVEK